MKLQELSLADLLPYWDHWDRAHTANPDIVAMRALALEDRYYLLVKILGRTDMLHPWIYARCREVERDPDGYLDLWAREHYKSTIITLGGSVQEILRNPEITIGIFSHTKPIAKAFLVQIKRELESNETLKALFPDVLYAKPENDSPSWSTDSGIIVRRKSNPKEATVEAHGLVDGQPTSKHFRLLVYDDVVVKESVSTPDQVAKTTEAWELSDNLSTVGGRKWHAGTRWSYADTYEEIIKKGVLKVRLHPATEDGTKEGKPVMFSQEELNDRLDAQGEATFSCQMLQNPLAGQQRMFRVEDLMVYEVRPHTLNAYLLVDPARSKKKDSANTAMVVLGMDYAGNKYLLDGFNHRMDLQERWSNLRHLYWKWIREPGIQSVRAGYEKFGAQADLDYFYERMRIEKQSFPIAELEWPREGEGSKIDRVQRLGPDIRTHKMFLPYPTDDKRLTKVQQQLRNDGHGYRVATPIRRRDENQHIYDLTEQFKVQVHYFPFGTLKDLVDAASRIYDIEPSPPIVIDESQLEPEYV